MPKLYFAWLGSGRTKRCKVGAEGRYLDQAAHAGLPVPPGAVLLDELFHFALENDLLAQIDRRVFCPDPPSLHALVFESLRLPVFERPIVVRAVRNGPAIMRTEGIGKDGAIDSQDVNQLCGALTAAWSEIEQADAAGRKDIVLVETIAATTAGSAVSTLDADVDMIYPDSPGLSAAASGSAGPGPGYELGRLGGWKLPDSSLPAYEQRLQMLLRGVRRSLGHGDWHLKWADDGSICWLVGLHQRVPNNI